MLVLDDGWFGARSSDNCALGDWVVNEEKLPGGLSGPGGGNQQAGNEIRFVV